MLLELKALLVESKFISSIIKGFEHEGRLLMDIRVAQWKHSGPITTGPRSLNTL